MMACANLDWKETAMPDHRNEPTASIATRKAHPGEGLLYRAPKLVRLDAEDTQVGMGIISDSASLPASIIVGS